MAEARKQMKFKKQTNKSEWKVFKMDHNYVKIT